MAPRTRPLALILDYGNVLTRRQRPEHFVKMAALAGLPPDEFVQRYWNHRLDFDRGLATAEYWQRVAALRPLTDTEIGALIEADAESWMDYREELWDLALRFRRGGGLTAILSNGVPEITSQIRSRRDLLHWFNDVVISCEVGYAKPDPAIYELSLQRLGIAPDGALFVDDRPENIAAAHTLGMQTLLFASDDDVAALERILSGIGP